MRAILLVAMREFGENARTKGFWIGLILFPVIITLSIWVQALLEEATPTRNYLLVDQSGQYEEVIEESMASLHRAEILEALGAYQAEYLRDRAPTSEIDLETIPAPGAAGAEAIERMTAGFEDELEVLLSEDGLEAVLAQLRPLLVDDAPDFEEPRSRFRRVELPDGIDAGATQAELVEALRPWLRGDRRLVDPDGGGEGLELFAAVLIPADVEDSVRRPGDLAALAAAGAGAEGPGAAPRREGIQYWGTNLADEALKQRVERAVTDELHRREYLARGMDAAQVAEVQDIYLPVASLNPNKEVGQEEVSMADVIRQWAPVGFVYLLWIGIFSISQMLLNNTIEEKSNRIIEVLLSSVTPGELMMGKLAGIAAIGMTMIGVWMTSLVLILKANAGPQAEFPTMLYKVLSTSGLIPAFLMYFILGYLLYAALFLAIGSVCNTLKEAQNLMGPVMIVMMVPIITMVFIPKDPNGTLARVLSWIPLYTPFTMMNRAAADPPMIDKVGTLVVLALFTLFTLWMVGRVFRAGILSTGQPPKLRELWRWVRG